MDTSEFTDEQIEALQALADGYNDQSVSRRDVMKLVGAGGVGALLGGGGAVSATDQASAGTAQSGQLGAIGDPLDLVIEDLIDQSGNVVASANAGVLEGTDLQYESVNAERADMGASGHGPVVSKELADVVVYYGSESDIRTDFYVRAVNQNGVVDEFVGDVVGSTDSVTTVLKSALSAAAATQRAGYVNVVPNTGLSLNVGNQGDSTTPILEVPENVTLDISGMTMGGFADATAGFQIKEGSVIVASGAYLNTAAGLSNMFLYDADTAPVGNGVVMTGVFGYPSVEGPFSGNVVRFQNSGSDKLQQTVTEVYGTVGCETAVSIENTGTGYINGNTIRVAGKFDGAPNIFEFLGSGDVLANWIVSEQIQARNSSGSLTDIARFENGELNYIVGILHDMNTASNGFTFTAGAGGRNVLGLVYSYPTVVNNSGSVQNVISPLNSIGVPQDLSGLTSASNGWKSVHDGTDDGATAVPMGPAIWDASLASGLGNWRSVVDGTVFGPN